MMNLIDFSLSIPAIGGFSYVFRVEEEGTKETFALKRINLQPEDLDQLQHEVQIMVPFQLVIIKCSSLLTVEHRNCYPSTKTSLPSIHQQ